MQSGSWPGRGLRLLPAGLAASIWARSISGLPPPTRSQGRRESPPMTSWVLVGSACPGCTWALVLEGQPSGPDNLVSTQLGGMCCCVCRWGLAPKSSAWLRTPGAAWRVGQAQAPPDCFFWPGGGHQLASGPSMPGRTCQAGLGVSQSGWPPEDWQAWLLGCPLPLHPPTEPRWAVGADWTGAVSLEKDVDPHGVVSGRDSCQPAGGRRQNRGTTQPRQNARPRLSARGSRGSQCQAVLTSVRNDAPARQETAG